MLMLAPLQTINLYHVKEHGWEFIANYDAAELHHNGPGDVPGAPGGPYGWDRRNEGKSSKDEAAPAPAPAP